MLFALVEWKLHVPECLGNVIASGPGKKTQTSAASQDVGSVLDCHCSNMRRKPDVLALHLFFGQPRPYICHFSFFVPVADRGSLKCLPTEVTCDCSEMQSVL